MVEDNPGERQLVSSLRGKREHSFFKKNKKQMGATDSRVCDVCEKWAGAEDGFHPIGDEGPQKDSDILGAAPYEDPKATVEGGSAERKAG